MQHDLFIGRIRASLDKAPRSVTLILYDCGGDDDNDDDDDEGAGYTDSDGDDCNDSDEDVKTVYGDVELELAGESDLTGSSRSSTASFNSRLRSDSYGASIGPPEYCPPPTGSRYSYMSALEPGEAPGEAADPPSGPNPGEATKHRRGGSVELASENTTVKANNITSSGGGGYLHEC